MKLDLIQTFVEVVRAGGFTAAARHTQMPRSTVSLQVKMLEEALGVRLLKRSTRSLALTDEGQRLYAKASGAVDDLVQVFDDVQARDDTLSGLIRLTIPADFPTSLLASAITSFSEAHPAVRFQILSTNAVLDLVQDNIDIAIRVGASPAQTAIERRLLDIEWGFMRAHRGWSGMRGRIKSAMSEISFHRRRLCAPIWKSMSWGAPLFLPSLLRSTATAWPGI